MPVDFTLKESGSLHSFYANKDYSLFGVIGNPISHSKSPELHNHWLKLSGLSSKAQYIKINITNPADLKEIILTMPKMGFVGCNITVPFKEDVFNIISELEEQGLARSDINTKIIGAVNCLFFNPDTGVIEAYNTDWIGYIQAFVKFKQNIYAYIVNFLNLDSPREVESVDYKENVNKLFCENSIPNEAEFKNIVNNYRETYNRWFYQPLHEMIDVLLIGAGGAARSVIVNYGFKSITITNRTHQKAISLVEHFNKNDINGVFKKLKAISLSDIKIQDYDLIINATSLGLRAGEYPDIDYNKISKSALCYDLIYPKDSPESLTPFLQKCLDSGIDRQQLCNGYTMLIGQAAESYKIWTGHEVIF
jgi:shikimate 5-dehydrogenase